MVKKKSVGKKGYKKNSDKDSGKINKKLLSLTIGVFLICSIALLFIGPEAQVTGHASAYEGEFSFITNMFTQWGQGNLDINIAKYILFFILTAIIFALLKGMKVPKSTTLQILIAIPISFLATAYITPEEVFTILTTYTALGLTFGILIPFALLILVSSMILTSKRQQAGFILLELMMWLLFVGFSFYKMIAGYNNGIKLSTPMGFILLGVFILSLLILVFNKKFRHYVRKLWFESQHHLNETEVSEQQATRMAQAADRGDRGAVNDMREMIRDMSE